MSTIRPYIKAVSSSNLVFGLDWFALLGGAPSREIRIIARQHRATHAVYAGEDAGSVGITTLPAGKRGMVLYSAAQLVAQRFASGAVAMIMPLDNERWWLVGVHDGAVIARTDYVCTSYAEAVALTEQLRQAYPTLILMDDKSEQPSMSELAADLYLDAELRRVAYRSSVFFSPVTVFALGAAILFLLYKAWSLSDISGHHEPSSSQAVSPEQAWNTAIRNVTDARWVHGIAGTRKLLLSLYEVPVGVAGWQLLQLECVSRHTLWQCQADYSREHRDASNALFLSHVPDDWEVSFISLEKAQARWTLESQGLVMTQTVLRSGHHNERYLFSRLQAIRPAFATISIDNPEPLPVPAPFGDAGQALPRPSALPDFRMRGVRIQAPLRSASLLMPYCDAIAWHKVMISVSPNRKPDLVQSRLSVTFQGVLYEQV